MNSAQLVNKDYIHIYIIMLDSDRKVKNAVHFFLWIMRRGEWVDPWDWERRKSESVSDGNYSEEERSD